MQRFFDNFRSLDHFTLSLDCQTDALTCPHCSKSNQLVSHGVMYRQRSMEEREAVGKRVLCSNRYRRSGCGRTFPLYLAYILPGLRYGAAQLSAFLSLLLGDAPVEAAYRQATAQSEPRHAWRWLAKLDRRLTDFRCFLNTPITPSQTHFGNRARARRLRLLLPTLAPLSLKAPGCACSHYQLQTQSPFI